MFNVFSTAHCQLRTMLTQRHIVDTDTQWVGGWGGLHTFDDCVGTAE